MSREKQIVRILNNTLLDILLAKEESPKELRSFCELDNNENILIKNVGVSLIEVREKYMKCLY